MDLRRHRRAAWLAPVAAALLLGACDAGDLLRWSGVRSFRTVSASEGRRLCARSDARLVLALTPRGGAQVADAQGVGPDQALPGDLPIAAPVVVLAREPEDGYRLAARLARAGIQNVALVEGGVTAWEIEAARAGAGKPARRGTGG